MPRHVHFHPYNVRVTSEEGHEHVMRGQTSSPITDGGSHYHRLSGVTSTTLGHHHHYCGVTGPAQGDTNGQHTHAFGKLEMRKQPKPRRQEERVATHEHYEDMPVKSRQRSKRELVNELTSGKPLSDEVLQQLFQNVSSHDLMQELAGTQEMAEGSLAQELGHSKMHRQEKPANYEQELAYQHGRERQHREPSESDLARIMAEQIKKGRPVPHAVMQQLAEMARTNAKLPDVHRRINTDAQYNAPVWRGSGGSGWTVYMP